MSDSEHRSDQRRRVLKQAQIVTNAGQSTIDCLIRDISVSGARLKVENSWGIPAEFELRLVADDARAPAQVVWRKAKEIGVRFTVAAASDKAA